MRDLPIARRNQAAPSARAPCFGTRHRGGSRHGTGRRQDAPGSSGRAGTASSVCARRSSANSVRIDRAERRQSGSCRTRRSGSRLPIAWSSRPEAARTSGRRARGARRGPPPSARSATRPGSGGAGPREDGGTPAARPGTRIRIPSGLCTSMQPGPHLPTTVDTTPTPIEQHGDDHRRHQPVHEAQGERELRDGGLHVLRVPRIAESFEAALGAAGSLRPAASGDGMDGRARRQCNGSSEDAMPARQDQGIEGEYCAAGAFAFGCVMARSIVSVPTSICGRSSGQRLVASSTGSPGAATVTTMCQRSGRPGAGAGRTSSNRKSGGWLASVLLSSAVERRLGHQRPADKPGLAGRVGEAEGVDAVVGAVGEARWQWRIAHPFREGARLRDDGRGKSAVRAGSGLPVAGSGAVASWKSRKACRGGDDGKIGVSSIAIRHCSPFAWVRLRAMAWKTRRPSGA